MVVDETLDLVEHREMVGFIGDVRVRVELPVAGETPTRGDRVVVHADRYCNLP
jgi:hypothetical protein